MKLRAIVAFGLCAATLGASGAAQAATVTGIGDITLSGLSFEVTSTAGAVPPYPLNTSAAGTSSGISWTAAADTASGFNYGGYTCTDNCYAPPALAGAPATDRLHASYDFTITFGQTINWLLVAFSNDSSQLGGFDFGIAPTQVGGNVVANGTQLQLTSADGG